MYSFDGTECARANGSGAVNANSGTTLGSFRPQGSF